MTEQEAKRLETKTEWNGKANVCTHCRRVPEIFYVATGHDHTDYDIKWCPCREVKQTDEIAELKRQLEEALRVTFDPKVLDEMNLLQKQLAESQAREARLRDALRVLIEFELLDSGSHSVDDLCYEFQEAVRVYNEALPHDDTALKEYRDAVIDSVASKFSTRGEILATDEVAAEIRAMKGGE